MSDMFFLDFKLGQNNNFIKQRLKILLLLISLVQQQFKHLVDQPIVHTHSMFKHCVDSVKSNCGHNTSVNSTDKVLKYAVISQL